MDKNLFELLKNIETLDTEALKKVETWVEFVLSKREDGDFFKNPKTSP